LRDGINEFAHGCEFAYATADTAVMAPEGREYSAVDASVGNQFKNTPFTIALYPLLTTT
jgi:hypothetical protein